LRILLVSNYYPPYEVGGYEQLCRDVAMRLAEREHQIQGLTRERGVRPGEIALGSLLCEVVNTFAKAGGTK
jgi:hypothetical protein